MTLAHHIRQRSNFLTLKAKVLGLSAAEQMELDRLRSIRINESPWAVVIEPHPMNMDDWKAHVQRSRGVPKSLLATEVPKSE